MVHIVSRKKKKIDSMRMRGQEQLYAELRPCRITNLDFRKVISVAEWSCPQRWFDNVDLEVEDSNLGLALF